MVKGSMKQVFAVIRSHGPAWKPGLPDIQTEWEAHRKFMNDLEAEGLAVLGGPWGEDCALLVFRANSADEIVKRLERDPWEGHLLRTTRVEPLEIRIGKLV